MNTKDILIGIIIIILILIGYMKITERLKEKQGSSSYLQETIGTITKSKKLVEESKGKIKEQEEMFEKHYEDE